MQMCLRYFVENIFDLYGRCWRHSPLPRLWPNAIEKHSVFLRTEPIAWALWRAQ